MNSTVLVKKEMHIHGSWKAGYKVSDTLIKSIAAEVTSKPSRSGILWLSSSGLTIEMSATPDGKLPTSNKISFELLRDISVNPYQRKCLIIVYIDASLKFSVMACLSKEEKDNYDFAKAYKDHKNLRLQNSGSESPQNSPNWTLQTSKISPQRENSKFVQESYLKSSSPSSVSSPPLSFASNVGGSVGHQNGESQRSNVSYNSEIMSGGNNDYDDVFVEARTVVVHEPEDILREHAGWTLKGKHETFNVQIQTLPIEEDYDSESITSASTLRSVSFENLKPPDDNSTDISSDLYHTRTDLRDTSIIELYSVDKLTEQDTTNEENLHEQNSTEVNHQDDLVTNENNNRADEVHEKKEYDLRSCGIQTMNGSLGPRRYNKRQLSNRTSSSNSYREKAEAIRKKSSGTEPKSPNSDSPDSPLKPDHSTPHPRWSFFSGSQRQSTSSQGSMMSQTVKRTLSLGSTTVIKPIESVYSGRAHWRSNSSRGQRQIIIYAPHLNRTP